MNSLEEAINKAIDICIEENILKDYLLEHRAQAVDACMTQIIYEAAMRAQEREEGHEEGQEEGQKEDSEAD